MPEIGLITEVLMASRLDRRDPLVSAFNNIHIHAFLRLEATLGDETCCVYKYLHEEVLGTY